MKTKLDELLNFDSLAEAEKITGESYKKSDRTMWTGLALLQANSAIKKVALQERDDTLFHNSLDRYLRIMSEEGFETILDIPFEDEGHAEHFFVLFNSSKALLLAFDTYGGDQVNGGHIYFNLRLRDKSSRWELNCSNGCAKDDDHVIVGYLDCREAVRYRLSKLEAVGEFVTPWIEQPFLWLLHYGDTRPKDYDHKAITGSRIAMLPEYIREAIAARRPLEGRTGE